MQPSEEGEEGTYPGFDGTLITIKRNNSRLESLNLIVGER